MLACTPKKPQTDGVPLGPLSRLLCLPKQIAFPFDRVLCGMVAAGLCIDALCAFLGLSRALLDGHIERLELQTPNDKPYRVRVRGWSVVDTQRLIAWRAVGVHPDVIGENLTSKRSANAVRAKCRRLGIPAPVRGDMFRPDATQLTDPEPGFGFPTQTDETSSPADNCGRSAGPIQTKLRLPNTADAVEATPSSKHSRSPRSTPRPPGQRELPLMGVVAGADCQRVKPELAKAAPGRKLAPIPSTIADVDLSDLSWLSLVKHPCRHEPSVWVIGMLMMAGLHYEAAASLTCRTASSIRTLRTRMGVPVDRDRKKQTDSFDLNVARQTHDENGYIIRKAVIQSDPRYFWVSKNDRSTRLPPTHCKREHMIEGRSPLMTIITRAMLDERARAASASPKMMRAVS